MRDLLAKLYHLSLPTIGRIATNLNLKRPTIFCFHSVERQGDANRLRGSMGVTDAFLGDLIKHAKYRSIPIISLDECILRITADKFDPFVCLTFDDGYRDNYEVAFPILCEHSVPATIFLATALLDRMTPMWWHPLERAVSLSDEFGSGEHHTVLRTEADRQGAYGYWTHRFRALASDQQTGLVNELAACNPNFSRLEAFGSALEWDMVKEMATSGLITFGAHTVSHPVLADVSAAKLVYEIEASRDRCAEMIGLEIKHFAYPFGQPHEVGGLAPRIVEDAGFATAFTTTAATLKLRNTKDHFQLPRIMLTSKTQSLPSIDAYVSGLTEIIKGT